MAKITFDGNELAKYRSCAILFTAHPEYNGMGGDGPVYWDNHTRGMVSYHACDLKELLGISTENVLRHLNGKLPDHFVERFLKETGYKKEDAAGMKAEDILELSNGEKFFFELALSYVQKEVMRRNKAVINECVPFRAIDRYVLQMLERQLNENEDCRGKNYKSVSIGTMNTTRETSLYAANIPRKKDGDKLVTDKDKQSFDVKMLTMSEKKHPLTDDQFEFVKNVLPVIHRNRVEYSSNLDPELLRRYNHETSHASKVFQVDL